MAKLLVATVILSIVACTLASPTLQTCKCWDDFEAKQDDTGKVACHGKRLFIIKPCNMPAPVKCVCTEDTVTGILTDKEGTWCSQSKNGELVKKWACENKEEWAKYKVDYDTWEKAYLDEIKN